jgi:hypothetical protein
LRAVFIEKPGSQLPERVLSSNELLVPQERDFEAAT